MGVRTGLSSVPRPRQVPPPATHKANEVGAPSIPQQMGREALQGHGSGSPSGDDHVLREKGPVSAGWRSSVAMTLSKPLEPQLPVWRLHSSHPPLSFPAHCVDWLLPAMGLCTSLPTPFSHEAQRGISCHRSSGQSSWSMEGS